MIIEEKDLVHYGILRKSGRYPYGSGSESPGQRSKTFLDFVEDLKRRLGLGDPQVAEYLDISTTQLRQLRSIAKEEQKASQISQAQRLKDNGHSNVAVGQRMGLNESTVRTLLAPGAEDKANVIRTTADMLRAQVDEKGLLDVGSGVENHIGVSKERKDTAIALLMEEGYTNHYFKVPQLGGTGKDTTQRVLGPPGMTSKEAYANRFQVRSISDYSEDGGRTFFGILDPLAINPNRVGIRYGEDGGGVSDGVIFVRRGVDDVSLGGSTYAQVRIRVGENHYIKGMAIYKDDMPDGVDLLFNTAKSDTGNKLDALKDMRDEAGIIDPDNPFGSYIKRQIIVKDADGTERLTSAMNIVNEEGNWGGGSINPKTGKVDTGWSKSIASQVLSKQSPELARQQLAMTMERRQREFKEITALTNPTVRKKLLEEFADGTDAAAVHLSAAALPRQRWQVILPIDTLKDTEVFAPNFNDGESVALIRYPHGGTFEIPVLTVNNKHRDSVRTIGREAKDAIGINSKTAERLSGADFDGDTVLVIPNNNNRIRTTGALQALKGYDPRSEYKAYPGMPKISEDRKQREMGDVSNLITDMTIKGATHAEIARAVRHSMVVIDAEKHNLNYRQSAIDNGIRDLKAKYQGSARSGAATLISRAESPIRVPERTLRRASLGGPVDPVTGRRVYEYSGRTYVNKKGETVPSVTKVKRLDDTDDAATLSSGTPMERIYVGHSNRLKDLANQARLAALNTPRATKSASAAVTYSHEVGVLNAKLDLAIRNRPLERNAQVLANAISQQRRDANPNMDVETRRKIEFQALEEARRRTGAQRTRIVITQEEWNAIQAGAISDTKLSAILRNADMDVVRAFATPRVQPIMTSALTNRARAMVELGYTRGEIEAQLGVTSSTLDRALNSEQQNTGED